MNEIIKALGGKPFFFMSKEKLFPFLYNGISIWKEVGYSTIIFLAALAGVNPELYESAVIDGASRLQQTLYITLPGISQTILIVFVLSFTGVLNLFEPIYVLRNAHIIPTAEVLDTYTYDIGIVQAKLPARDRGGPVQIDHLARHGARGELPQQAVHRGPPRDHLGGRRGATDAGGEDLQRVSTSRSSSSFARGPPARWLCVLKKSLDVAAQGELNLSLIPREFSLVYYRLVLRTRASTGRS